MVYIYWMSILVLLSIAIFLIDKLGKQKKKTAHATLLMDLLSQNIPCVVIVYNITQNRVEHASSDLSSFVGEENVATYLSPTYPQSQGIQCTVQHQPGHLQNHLSRSLVEYSHIEPITGRELWYQEAAYVVCLSDAQYVVITLEKITERHAAYKQLRRMTTLVEAAPLFIAIIDRQKKLRYVNPQSMVRYGLTGNLAQIELPTQPLNGAHLDDILSRAEEQGSINLQAAMQVDGKEVVFSQAIFPLREPDGSCTEFGVHSVDVTDFIQAQSSMLVALEEAKQANQAKRDFLSRMTHDLRTPMNAIIGMATIATRDVSNAEKTMNCLNHILNSSDHLLTLINNILDFSKIEAGKFCLRTAPFDLARCCSTVTSLLAPRCELENITFRLEMGGITVNLLMGDELRIKQILLNLLGNAVKFTPSNGQVVLRVEQLNFQGSKVTLRFTVRDTGSGMSQETLNCLFQPYEQGQNGGSRGTGLGLVICKSLVNLMGGDIQVESELGKGSAFSYVLTFPVAESDDNTPQQKPAGYDFSNKRLLLVEDIEINRIIACELLSITHAVIEEAETGEQAVEMVERSPENYYDLIMMDIQLPGIDGYQATRCIRRLDRDDVIRMPIVALTANAFTDDIAAALEAGMSAHISKPIAVEQLLAVLGQFLI